MCSPGKHEFWIQLTTGEKTILSRSSRMQAHLLQSGVCREDCYKCPKGFIQTLIGWMWSRTVLFHTLFPYYHSLHHPVPSILLIFTLTSVDVLLTSILEYRQVRISFPPSTPMHTLRVSCIPERITYSHASQTMWKDRLFWCIVFVCNLPCVNSIVW